MKAFMYLCAFTIFILVSAGFSTTAYAHTIRVGLRSLENRDSISVSNTSIDVGRGRTDGSFDFSRTLTSSTGFTVSVAGGQIVVQAGGQTVFTFLNETDGGRQIRAADGGTITLGTNSYRGAIEFRLSGGRVSAINVICLEQYLYGVLPAEMSASFHIEALRAQAVAARTFAMYTRASGRYHVRGFDLCDRTCCQAYGGADREVEAMTQAVRDTRGLMIFTADNPTPAFTPFFSSSGGSTDNSENVWGGTVSHLRGVMDTYEQTPRLWSRSYTWAQLSIAVRAEAPNVNIGAVTGLEITREHLGRVQELSFIGTNGQWTATRQQILSIFRHIDRSLYSRNFYISGSDEPVAGQLVSVTCGIFINSAPVTEFYVLDAYGNVVPVDMVYVFDGYSNNRLTETVLVTGGIGITINGRGWGHGVGMSQHGANSMAHAGYCFRSILQHFYTGIVIRYYTQ